MDVHINYTIQMVLYSGCLKHPHISSKAMTLSGGHQTWQYLEVYPQIIHL